MLFLDIDSTTKHSSQGYSISIFLWAAGDGLSISFFEIAMCLFFFPFPYVANRVFSEKSFLTNIMEWNLYSEGVERCFLFLSKRETNKKHCEMLSFIMVLTE